MSATKNPVIRELNGEAAQRRKERQQEIISRPSTWTPASAQTSGFTPAQKSEMVSLENQRRQAQVDMDIDTMNALDARMKAIRASAGQQTFGDRADENFSGWVKGTAAAYSKAAEDALNFVKHLNTVNSNEYKAARQEEQNAAHYQEMLDRGTWDNGKPLTDADRAQLTTLIQRSGGKVKAASDYLDKVNAPVASAAEKVGGFGDRMTQESVTHNEAARTGATALEKILLDTGNVAGDVVSDFALNAMAPGLGTAARVTRMYGSGSRAAEEKGLGGLGQFGYGATKAALGEATNRLFSGNPILEKATGKGALDDILLPNLGRTVPGAMLKSGLGEAVEETAENLADIPIQKIFFGDKADQVSAKDIGYDALIAAIIGGITGISGKKSADTRDGEGNPLISRNTLAGDTPVDAEGNSIGAAENAVQGVSGGVMEQEAQRLFGNNNPPAQGTGYAATELGRPSSPLGVSATQEDTHSVAPSVGNANANMDPLLELLTGGKRVDQTKLTNEQFATLADRGDIGMDADGKVYQMDPAQHIDQRSSDDMGNRRIKAFQYDHPEIQPYYKGAAEAMLTELNGAVKGGETQTATGEYGQTYSWRNKRSASPRIASLLDGGMTYADIETALDAIIHDKGQENYANAKRVEMVLDDMLTNGYNDGTQFVPANQQYIAAKDAIAGSQTDSRGHWLDDIPVGDGLGNANAGTVNTAFDDMQAKSDSFHPVNPNSAQRIMNDQQRAPSEVPTVNPDTGKNIGKTVSTILNSPLTSPEMATQIESAVADGQFDYIPVTDRDAHLKAQQDLSNRGLQTVADSFIAKVELGQRITKNDTASAIAAYNQAVADGNHALAFDLMTAIADAAHDSAQVVQSMNLLNRLTPEGRLLTLRKYVDKLNRQNRSKPGIQTANKNATQEQVDADVTKAMQESIDDAYSLIRDIAEVFRRGGSRKTLADIVDRYPQYKNLARYFTDIDEYINGEKQSGWVETLGRELASKAMQRANPTPAKERTLYDTITGDLTAFMRQYVDNHRTTRKPRTAAERITDFFNNRNEYARAWATAKDSLRKKYSNNQQMMDRLEDFLHGTIGYNGSGPDTVMMKAVADAALDEDISIKEMTMRREYDRDAIVSQIADRLIRQTGARGGDADVIRDAVSRYVEEKIPQNGKTTQDYISRDIKATMKDFGVKLSDILTKSAQSKEALAKRISDSLVKEYGISQSGAQSIAEDISAKFSDMVIEASRKKVESMFKDRQKPVQKTAMQRFEEYANLGVFSTAHNEAATERLFGMQARIDPTLAESYVNAETYAERAAAWDAITTDIASQIPSTFREKANFWRYTSMLLNPTTHVRNFMGNAIQAGARTIKNGVGAVIERAAIKDASQRTKSVLTGKEGKALKDFAKAQYEADQSAAMGAGKYSDASTAGINREIQEKRKMFQGSNPLSKAVQAVGDFNTKLLDWGDLIFNKSAYVDSFAQALKAKGVTAEEADSGAKADLVAQARAYAIEEAQRATYRNTTALSEALSKMGRYEGDNAVLKGMSVAADAFMPFRRTPANILTTGMDYSPVGLAKAITYDAYQVKAGNMSATDMVDHLSAGLTGTGILALGAYLAAEGLLKVRTGDDDREKDYNEDRGVQEYSLQIGDKSYTLDWAVPAAMPLFAGAAIMESAGEGGSGFDAVMDAMGGISEVVLETSMLSSLNDLISNWSYADNKALYLLDRTATSYAGQYVPTVGGKIASAMDDTVRKSYVEKGTGQLSSDVNYFLQSMEKKIPGARQNLQPKVDLWGNEVSNGEITDRLIQSFVSPGYAKSMDTGKLDTEIRRLAEATGSSAVYPSEVEKSFKVGGETKNLTAEEYTKYAKTVGKTRKDVVSSLIGSAAYKKLSDEDKAKAVSYAYEYATVKGKQAVSSYKPSDSSFAKGAMNSVLPIDSYILYKITADKDGNGRVSAIESANALQGMSGLTDKQRWQEWARLNDGQNKADKASAAGLTVGEYASIKGKADANGNGTVTKDEAMQALAGQKNRADLWDIICTTSAKNPYR